MALKNKSENFRRYPSEVAVKKWQPVRQMIFSTAIRIGLSEPLSQMEQAELCRFLKKEFPDMNPDEVMHAIDLYCSQKLDYTADSYNKLSNLFLGNILQSYRRYRTAAWHSMKRERDRPEERTPLAELYEKVLFIPYDKMREGEPYPFTEDQEWMIYFNLNSKGFPFATPQRKHEIMNEIKARMEFPVKTPKAKKDHKIKAACMKQCFKEWVHEMVKNDVDIRAKLKPTLIEIDEEYEERRQEN